MDGGGLKGTGTASIRVKDINDMPPSFTKGEWVTEVDETDGNLLPDAPILTVTVHDEDESNKFHYKVKTTFKTVSVKSTVAAFFFFFSFFIILQP
jgi:hypothetical protein